MPLRRRRFGGGWAGAATAALPDRVIRAPRGGVGAGAGAGARRPSAMGLRARFATGSSDAAAAACERRERCVGGSAAPPPGQLIGGSANAVDSAGATFRRGTVAAPLSIAMLAMVAAALVESFAVPATTFLAFFAATTTVFFAFRAFAAALCAFRLASPFSFGRTS